MIFRRENDAARTTTATEGTRKHTRLRTALVAGAVIAAPVAGLAAATTASAATPSTWNAVAQCESSGNWAANTGNGFYGGLQFTPSTWAAFGGTAYAASADQATAAQQITVAENVLAAQGPGAWPVCGPQAGLTSNDTTDTTTAATTTTTAVTPTTTATSTPTTPSTTPATTQASTTPAQTTSTSTSSSYTVKPGDTLGGIANANGTTWQKLYAANTTTIGNNPDVITPGETLTLG
ncbi:transglycosylase family protein [Streptacidiphilus sp. P02-A3a]|uniref:LysM peptidoglycan-binding domain-containing protein n=1 Tax=Streptacidiphilus sp. P02-A3a TaxID=2704468 RepID=UPI0015F8A6EE|nr:transglycosylase family protein [Streptacidiphilus sp. P02-A3a]QMU71049.1 LysM peptidoglycan-binding domain-containing protein [Streptacidiphilus sp. P02-A3a]